jgi:50S ribosomal protein L16 3-hydroxylase
MQGKLAWLNGEAHTLTEQQQPLVQLLASKRRYQKRELDAVMTPTARELLHEWIEQGYFSPL